MKTTISVLSGIALGYFIGTIVSRPGLFKRGGANDDLSGHTFAINELTSRDSVSLDALKEKIRRGS